MRDTNKHAMPVNGRAPRARQPVLWAHSTQIHTPMALIPEEKRNVAVLGASQKPERYSNQAVRLLASFDYRPMPVNPAVEEIEGLKCFPRLAAIGETGPHRHPLPRGGTLDAFDRGNPGHQSATNHPQSRRGKRRAGGRGQRSRNRSGRRLHPGDASDRTVLKDPDLRHPSSCGASPITTRFAQRRP